MPQPNLSDAHHGAGWVNTIIYGDRVRLPKMVKIPFTMSHECHQWGNLGAVTKGRLDPEGCAGCKWAPGRLNSLANPR